MAATVAVALSLWHSAVRAQSREYDVKAAFLYNIVNFVTWPPAAFASADQPVRVCIVDHDPFGPILDDIMKGETESARTIEVERLRGASDASRCHLVFVPRGSAHVDDVLRVTESRPIVTVGETPDFLKRGGLIGFVVENGRVRFDVNVAGAAARGLAFSSKLLRVARSTTVEGLR